MKDMIVGRLLAFRSAGSGDQFADQREAVLLQVTDHDADGTVEIAFDTSLPGKPRIYVAFKVQELLAKVMQEAHAK